MIRSTKLPGLIKEVANIMQLILMMVKMSRQWCFGHWKSGDVAIVVLVRLKDVLYKGYRETTYCSNISVIPMTTYHPKFPSIGTFLEVNTHKLTMLKCNSYTKGWWIYHNLRIICNFIIKYCYVKTCYIKANMTNQINKIGFE